ncbi:MAG TPA: 50S ribosomal protein L32 [Patescibacteria group bacterium]|nr:50S ribosomal protein L32 [Patescibacteria group bacterium]
MAVPKQKRSKSRRKRRKYQFRIKKANLRKCPECGKPIPSHQACPYCGKYKGDQVIKKQEDNKK